MDVDVATLAGILIMATFGFLFGGLLGVILVGFIVVLVAATTGTSGNDETSGTGNCPECGSRLAPENDECTYCGTPVDTVA